MRMPELCFFSTITIRWVILASTRFEMFADEGHQMGPYVA